MVTGVAFPLLSTCTNTVETGWVRGCVGAGLCPARTGRSPVPTLSCPIPCATSDRWSRSNCNVGASTTFAFCHKRASPVYAAIAGERCAVMLRLLTWIGSAEASIPPSGCAFRSEYVLLTLPSAAASSSCRCPPPEAIPSAPAVDRQPCTLLFAPKPFVRHRRRRHHLTA